METHNHICFIIILFSCTGIGIQTHTLVEARPVRSDTVVTDLLSTLFRQTIYNRIENLLLDPGKKSSEKQRIIDSAVDNYHKQKMILPTDQNSPAPSADLTGKIGT